MSRDFPSLETVQMWREVAGRSTLAQETGKTRQWSAVRRKDGNVRCLEEAVTPAMHYRAGVSATVTTVTWYTVSKSLYVSSVHKFANYQKIIKV